MRSRACVGGEQPEVERRDDGDQVQADVGRAGVVADAGVGAARPNARRSVTVSSGRPCSRSLSASRPRQVSRARRRANSAGARGSVGAVGEQPRRPADEALLDRRLRGGRGCRARAPRSASSAPRPGRVRGAPASTTRATGCALGCSRRRRPPARAAAAGAARTASRRRRASSAAASGGDQHARRRRSSGTPRDRGGAGRDARRRAAGAAAGLAGRSHDGGRRSGSAHAAGASPARRALAVGERPDGGVQTVDHDRIGQQHAPLPRRPAPSGRPRGRARADPGARAAMSARRRRGRPQPGAVHGVDERIDDGADEAVALERRPRRGGVLPRACRVGVEVAQLRAAGPSPRG